MLLHPEQMHKNDVYFTKIVEVVILSENSCRFVSSSACMYVTTVIFFSAWISNVLNETTPEIQNKK